MKYSSVCAVLLLLGACAAKNRPHVVFFLADDLGWSDVSFHGSKQIPTPNIDALARDGVILNNYYTASTCSPSRAALMTSKYPIRVGFQHEIIKADEPWGLSLDEKIMPEYFKSLNYSTHGVGKWHLGFFSEDYLPQSRGFDSFFGYWTGVEDYYTHFADCDSMTGLDLHDDSSNVWSYNGTYGTEIYTDKAVQIILQHNPAKPLFLFIAQQSPHTGNFENPLQVPEKYVSPLVGIENENRSMFAGMVSSLDFSVGEVFDALDRAQMLEDTIFVFSTDNGGVTQDADGAMGSNFPLRGCKYNLWEGGVRATAFVWSQSIRRHAHIHNGMMHITDWLPTLVSAVAGPEASKSLGFVDGMDMWGSIAHNLPSPRDTILLNIDPVDDVEGLRWRDFKLVKGSYYDGIFDGWYDVGGIRITGKHQSISEELLEMYRKNYLKYMRRSKVPRILWQKYAKDPLQAVDCLEPACRTFPAAICHPQQDGDVNSCEPNQEYCLFNIATDPCERNNIADQYPEVVQYMVSLIDYYRTQAIPPGDQAEDPASNPVFHGNAWVPWR